jgi:hypothetical protein
MDARDGPPTASVARVLAIVGGVFAVLVTV